MGVQLGDLDSYLDDGLSFQAKGADGEVREYEVPAPSAALGLWCQRAAELVGRAITVTTAEDLDNLTTKSARLPSPPGDEDLTWSQRMLGVDLHSRLLADGVSHHVVEFAGHLAFVWIVSGEEAAALFAQSGGRPQPPGPTNRQERRAAQRAASSSTTTSTVAGTMTPRPGSGSGTRSRPRSRRSGRRSQSPGAES